MRASVGGAPTFFRLFLLTFTSTSGSAFNEPDGEAVAGSAFDEPDSEAVAGADDMLQLTSAVTDYLLILLLFQLYSCVCRSLRSAVCLVPTTHNLPVRPYAIQLISPFRHALRATADDDPARP